MDFQLGSLFKATTKVEVANNSCSEINNRRIKILDAPSIQFSDESYSWNRANLSLIKLSNKYKQFVNDEVIVGKTNKEFWEGVETSALEDFVDKHYGSLYFAIFRYFILLTAILMVELGFLLKPVLIQYLYQD